MRAIFPRGSIVAHGYESIKDYLDKITDCGIDNIPVLVEYDNHVSSHTLRTGLESAPHDIFNSAPVRIEWLDLVPGLNRASDMVAVIKEIPGVQADAVDNAVVSSYFHEANGVQKWSQINLIEGIPQIVFDRIVREIQSSDACMSDTLYAIPVYGQSTRAFPTFAPLGNKDKSSVVAVYMPEEGTPYAIKETPYGLEGYSVSKWKQNAVGIEYIIGLGIMESRVKRRITERTPMTDAEGILFYDCDYKYMGSRVLVNSQGSMFYLTDNNIWSPVPESMYLLDEEINREIVLYQNMLE